ncbi:Ficolin-2 [Dirofilaria immitis]
MREYNNQDVKVNENELDPCIAAEIRMKKVLFSQRTRRNLLILLIFIATVILLSVLLFLLLSRTSSKGTALQANVSLPETNSETYHNFASSPITTTKLSTISIDSATLLESPSPKVIEIDDDAFLENPADTELVSDFFPAITKATTIATTVTTLANIAKMPHFLIKSTNNTGIKPMTTSSSLIRTNKQTKQSIISPLLLGNDDEVAQDCKELLEKGKTEDGIYQISLPKIGKFDVLCDMKTDGGGWTIIQKRQDGQVYFANRTWNEYVNGFGELTTSFWLGLDKIHALSAKDNGNSVILRIELRGDLCEDKSGCSKQPNGYWWGEWDFNIGNASQKYILSISPALTGNLSERTTIDRFHYMNNGKLFTTIDQDNDKFQGNCAQFRDFGGWWHNDCGYVALNGRYGDRSSKMRNMFWFYALQITQGM